MTSSIAWPRSCLADCSPRTHRTASETLDLPEPLGPTTTVTPGSSCITLLSAKDLNPLSVSDLRCTVPLENGRWQARNGACETRRKVYHRARANPAANQAFERRFADGFCEGLERRGGGHRLGLALRAAGPRARAARRRPRRRP